MDMLDRKLCNLLPEAGDLYTRPWLIPESKGDIFLNHSQPDKKWTKDRSELNHVMQRFTEMRNHPKVRDDDEKARALLEASFFSYIRDGLRLDAPPECFMQLGELAASCGNNIRAAGWFRCAAVKFGLGAPWNNNTALKATAIEKSTQFARLVDDDGNAKLRALVGARNRIAETSALARETVEQFCIRSVQNTLEIEGLYFGELEIENAMKGRKTVSKNKGMELLDMLEARREMHKLVAHAHKSHRIPHFGMEEINSLHRTLMQHEPSIAGAYRTAQVYVGKWTPTRCNFLLAEVAAFEKWLNSEETLGSIHPIELAALAFIRIIHPYCDGNGRVGRLMVDYLLLRAGYPPICECEQSSYYDALNSAHAGDVWPFVCLLRECVGHSLGKLGGRRVVFNSFAPMMKLGQVPASSPVHQPKNSREDDSMMHTAVVKTIEEEVEATQFPLDEVVLIAEGGNKQIYSIPGKPEWAIVRFIDSLTTGSIYRQQRQKERAIDAHRTTCNVFRFLNKLDVVPTHFVCEPVESPLEFTAQRCKMLPFKWKVSRQTWEEPKNLSLPPKIEVFRYKENPSFAQPLTDEQILNHELSATTIGSGVATKMRQAAGVVFQNLEQMWRQHAHQLVCMEMRFGVNSVGSVVLADSIDADCWQVLSQDNSVLTSRTAAEITGDFLQHNHVQ